MNSSFNARYNHKEFKVGVFQRHIGVEFMEEQARERPEVECATNFI